MLTSDRRCCLLVPPGACCCLLPQELEVCVGIDVDPVAHRTAAAALQPLLGQQGAPTLHQLTGNYRCEGGRQVLGLTGYSSQVQ
jgi:hypothetical protein